MTDFIKQAFVSGELAPAFYGRTELSAYENGVAKAENWFVDYRGGLLTRSGTSFDNMVPLDTQPVRLLRFRSVNPEESDILLIFGHQYLRFMRDGAYLLDSPSPSITSISKANPAVVTKVGHGLITGDWVQLNVTGMTQVNGRFYHITKLTNDTYSLQDLFGTNINSTSFGTFTAGTYSRVSNLVTPYDSADLAKLHNSQRFNFMGLYHPDHPEQTLERFLAPEGPAPIQVSWDIYPAVYGSTLTRPGTIVLTPSAVGTAGMGYIVTAVDYDDVESLPSDMKIHTTSVNFVADPGQMVVEWGRVTGARYYNVYRTIVLPTGTEMTKSQQVGFIGRAFGTRFVDNNIIPDFAKTAPLRRRPFENGVVEVIEVTAPGSGYSDSGNTVTITPVGSGAGFVGYPVIVGGELTAVVIVDGGHDYSIADTVTVTGGGGTGATANITQVSPDEGNNPATSAIFQTRRVYGGTLSSPMTIVGSKPAGQFTNFDVSFIPRSTDSYNYTMDESDVDPIQHLLKVDDALMIFTATTVQRLVPETGRSINALSAATELEVDNINIGDVPPLAVNNDILVPVDKGSTVMALVFNQYSTRRLPQDLGALSGHLFTSPIIAMDWAKEPHNILYVVRDDGVLLFFTYSREQEVFGWCPQTTKGLFRDVCVVKQGLESCPYFVVERFVRGGWHRFIEHHVRRKATLDDYWGVDSGLAYTGTSMPAATLDLVAGEYILTASVASFNSGMVGWVARAGGGRFTITAYTDSTHVKVAVGQACQYMPLPADDVPATVRFAAGWTLAAPVTTLSGLEHLEGRTVALLADGAMRTQRTVVNGTISLTQPATQVFVGLPYSCIGKTLPLSDQRNPVNGKMKRYVGTAIQVDQTRGLKLGTRLDRLYDDKESPDLWGEPIPLHAGVTFRRVSSNWKRDDGLYFVQDNPLPAAVLGLVFEAEVAD